MRPLATRIICVYLGAEVAVLGHPLPLGPRLDVVHLVLLVLALLLPVTALSLLHLRLVSFVPGGAGLQIIL